jgi:hypothetical protein
VPVIKAFPRSPLDSNSSIIQEHGHLGEKLSILARDGKRWVSWVISTYLDWRREIVFARNRRKSVKR